MRKKDSLMRKWIVLIAILVIISGGLKFYWDYLISPVDTQKTQVSLFAISGGEATKQVAERLEKNGLIRSAKAFILLAKRSKQNQIQAGNFQLAPSMSAGEVLKTLAVGVVDKKVVLIEGWRVEEMAERLDKELGEGQDNFQKEEFLKLAKEGYMFPDTYFLKPDTREEEVVKILQTNFDQKYDAALQSKIKSIGLTAKQGVILASIVEREARSDEARTVVASILLKRLKIGIALNADATIQYLLGYQPKEKSWWKKHLTKDDMKVDSPYNTYLHAGLPPAPISNPSLSSLRAVAEADSQVPYLYYYHDSEGRSHYARTLEEHNLNISNFP